MIRAAQDARSYEELLPHPALQAFVDRLWLRRGGGPEEPLRVLPDGCIDVIVDLADDAAGTGFVVGAMTRPLIVAALRPRDTVAVRFRPGGAVAFLRAPAHAFTDRRITCADAELDWLVRPPLLGGGGAEPLVRAARALERRLLRRLPAQAPDPLVDHAVRALFAASSPGVARLAARIGYSRQHLTRRFQAQIGLSPKQLERVARLQRAVVAVQDRGRPDGPSLAGVATGAGYFDEAHMDREFRALVGLTPGRVMAAKSSIRPIASLLDVA